MNEQETAPLPQLEPERCWVCGGPVGEPYTDGDGGPVCCSARCLRECRADLYGDDEGPGDLPEESS